MSCASDEGVAIQDRPAHRRDAEARKGQRESFWSIYGYTIVSRLIASLLLLAGVLKSRMLWATGWMATGSWENRWLVACIVGLEISLALWLFIGCWAKTGWVVALCCFGLFLGVSLGKAIAGTVDCGCFGNVSINPWITAMIDLASICGFLTSRPKLKQGLTPIWNRLFFPGVGLLVLAGLLGASRSGLNPTSSQLVISPAKIQWERVYSASQKTEPFVVTNVSNQSVTIARVTTTCDCVTADLSPMVLQPAERRGWPRVAGFDEKAKCRRGDPNRSSWVRSAGNDAIRTPHRRVCGNA